MRGKILLMIVFVIVYCMSLAIWPINAQKPTMPATGSDNSTTGKVVRFRIVASDAFRMQFIIAQSDVEKAQLQLKLAESRRENVVLNIRGSLKVPEDYQGKIGEDGSIYFDPPPEPSPSPTK